jgi:tRNA (guanine37-N1)-methyltransferase
LLEGLQYTRPECFEGRRVPPVLLSGDHAAIRRWRLKQAVGRTYRRRPKLLAAGAADAERSTLLEEFLSEAPDRDGRAGQD